MQNLFAYGTLMCGDIMEEVSGCRLYFKSGTLTDFSRRKVKGEHYPAIFQSEKGAVEGIVYLDVPHSAWLRLDRFEGDMYARQLVQVELADGIVIPVDTYVIQPAFIDFLDAFDWNFENFVHLEKESFQKHYKGYQLMDKDKLFKSP